MSDQNLLLSVLNVLSHEFDTVVVLVSFQQNSMSLHEAQYMLMIQEQMIEHLNTVAHVDVIPSANFVSNSNGGNRSNFKDRGPS